MKRLERKDKYEKRRLTMNKQNARQKKNMAMYGAENGTAVAVGKTRAFSHRIVAALLALVFALSCIVVGINLAARADANTANLTPGKVSDTDSGMVLNKYLTPNTNGDYDLTLEAYSTADMKTVTEKVPTDFVIVVDQSGSMDTRDMPTGTPTVQNNKYLEDIANGAYFYKDGDNYYRVYGVKDYLYRYYPANYWFTGNVVDYLGTDIGWFMGETDATTDIDNAFYFREVVDGEVYYLPIKTTIEGKIGTYYMKFSYPSKLTGSTYEFDRENTTYSSNGNSPWYHNVLTGTIISSGPLYDATNTAVQTLYRDDHAYTYSEVNLPWPFSDLRTGMYINYPMYGRHLSYTKLCYRDVNGVEHEVPSNNAGRTTWEYCDDDGNARSTQDVASARPTYSNLYTFDNNIRRVEALQVALSQFAQAVADETDTFGHVDNKVSIVGFSGGGESTYQNTELLTGSTFTIQRGSRIPSNSGYSSDGYNHNGIMKSQATSADYAGALVDSTNGNVGVVNSEITEAINAITAYGGTQPEDGLNMAYEVLTNRNETTYTLRSGPHKGESVNRNTIVIFFTDGQPGDYHESNQYSEANEVVAQAKAIKDFNDTSLFSIGVFGESDGNPLTYSDRTATRESDTKAWKYLGGWMETYRNGNTYYCLRRQWRPGADGYTAEPNDTIFDYMSVVSSNYPDAQNYIAPAWLNGNFNGNYIEATDGVRNKATALESNEYYRMASNQDTLIEAFLQAVAIDSQETSIEIKMDATAVLKDVIDTTAFELPTNPTATVQTAEYTLTSDTDTIEDNRWATPVDSALSALFDVDRNQVTVTGFDYSTNYIAWDKPATGDLPANTGRKLIVTILGVKPLQTVTTSGTKTLYSNTSDASVTSGDGETSIAFLMPSITRHSYALNVTGDNASEAVFNVVPSLAGGSSSTADVILVTPNGRVKYSDYVADGSPAFSMSNGKSFYFENVPLDYQVNTSITATDNNYIYTWTDNSNVTLDQTTAEAKNYDFEDSTIYISSVANTRSVTIKETVDGPYSNTSSLFSPTITLVPPAGITVPDTLDLGNGVTATRSGDVLVATLSNIEGSGNDVRTLTIPFNYTLKIAQDNSDTYYENPPTANYTDEDHSTATDYDMTGGQNIAKDTDITIINYAPDIPVTGSFDRDSSPINFVIRIILVITAAAGAIYLIFFKRKLRIQ